MKYVLTLSAIAFLTACTEQQPASATKESVDIHRAILGEWRTPHCMALEKPPMVGPYIQISILFNDNQFSTTYHHFADKDCTDFEYATPSTFEDYSIGQETLSSSGLVVNEIDLNYFSGDVTVTDYQIIKLMDNQLYLGVPVYDEVRRSTELDFDTPYQKVGR